MNESNQEKALNKSNGMKEDENVATVKENYIKPFDENEAY